MFRQWRSSVRSTKTRSKFLVCLNGRPQKVDMSRLVQNSLRVCWNTTIQCCSQTVALRRHVFFERPLRQTRNPSDASLWNERWSATVETLPVHKIGVILVLSANSRFWISRPKSRSRLGSHARGSQPLAGSHPRNAKHEPRFIRR